jgi:hypothetical protein
MGKAIFQPARQYCSPPGNISARQAISQPARQYLSPQGKHRPSENKRTSNNYLKQEKKFGKEVRKRCSEKKFGKRVFSKKNFGKEVRKRMLFGNFVLNDIFEILLEALRERFEQY